MKKICAFLLVLVAVFLVGCAKTPGTEVFRFEVRSYELTVGESVQLDLILGSHEGEEVVFEIVDDNPAIETVETYETAVKIKAKEVGTAEFKAYLKETENVNDVIVITVSNPKLDYINLSAEKSEIFVGEQVKVEAIGSSLVEGFTPTFAFETSNKKIATVDENGLVTAVGGGKVEIVAYEKNDPTLYQTISLNVKYVETASLVIEETNVDLKVGDTYKIKAVAYDDKGNTNTVSQLFKYIVTPSKKVSISDEGVVKGIDAGTVTINVTSGTKKEKLTINVTYKDEIESDELVLINGLSSAISFSEHFGVKNLSAKVISGDAETIVLSSKDTKVKGVKTGEVVVNLTNGTVSKDVTIKVIDFQIEKDQIFKVGTGKVSFNWSEIEVENNVVESGLKLYSAEKELEFQVSSSNEDVFKASVTEDGFKLDVINTGVATLKITSGSFEREFVITIANK